MKPISHQDRQSHPWVPNKDPSDPETILIPQMVNKCIKIVTLLDEQQRVPLKIGKQQSPVQMLAFLVNAIYEIVENKKGSQSEIEQIQSMLQKQENLNRTLIKKQLEYREEHKVLLNELTNQRQKCQKLNQYVNKLSEETKDKDLTILQVKNQLKASQKERRIFDEAKVDLISDFKFSSYMSKQLPREDNVLRLGHKRRNSQDINKKIDKNEVKKKQKLKKDKQKGQLSNRKRNLLTSALK